MRRTAFILFLLGTPLISACATGPQAVTSTQTPRNLKEYEVVWHKEGQNNETSTGWYRSDDEAKDFFINDVLVKIIRIEPSGERVLVCDSREGMLCR